MVRGKGKKRGYIHNCKCKNAHHIAAYEEAEERKKEEEEEKKKKEPHDTYHQKWQVPLRGSLIWRRSSYRRILIGKTSVSI